MRDPATTRFPLDPDLPLDEMMRRWPSTIPVMLRHRFLCVGCPIAPFHTLLDACHEHGADLGEVTAEIGEAVGGTVPPPAARAVRSCGSRQSASGGADR